MSGKRYGCGFSVKIYPSLMLDRLERPADKDWKLKGVKDLGDMAGRRVVPTEAGDQTKERILSAAEQLFAKSGFDGVSMRDIGRAAEVPFALIT